MKKNTKIALPQNVEYIINTLYDNGFEGYIVGGCVRDSILNIKPKDWDIATNATPSQIKQVFKNDKLIPTGEKYGTLTLLLDNVLYEITTYKADGNCADGRRPEVVSFSSLLEDDLLRRDFTINALAYNSKFGLIDYYNGIADIQNKIIRVVGNQKDRFNEDGLRVIRAVRFACSLDFTIEPATLSFMKDTIGNLKGVAKERIASELKKILPVVTSKNAKYFELVISEVIPQLNDCKFCMQNNPHHIYNVFDHTICALINSEKNIVVRLAVLLHDIGKVECKTTDEFGIDHFYGHPKVSAEMSKLILYNLKFENKIIEDVEKLILFHDIDIESSKKSIKKIINKIGINLVDKLLKVKIADILAQQPEFIKSKLERIEKIYGFLVINIK